MPAINPEWTVYDDQLAAEQQSLMTGLDWSDAGSFERQRVREIIDYFKSKNDAAAAQGIEYSQKVKDTLQKLDSAVTESKAVAERRYHEVLGGQAEVKDSNGNVVQAYQAPTVKNYTERQNDLLNNYYNPQKTGYANALATQQSAQSPIKSGYASALTTQKNAQSPIKSKYAGLGSTQATQLGQVAGGYDTRFSEGMGLYDDYGIQMNQDVTNRYDQALSRNMDNLSRRGLNNTTIGSNLDNQALEQANQEYRRVGEGITGQKANYWAQLSGDALQSQERNALANTQLGLQGLGYDERTSQDNTALSLQGLGYNATAAQDNTALALQGLGYNERVGQYAQALSGEPLAVMERRTDTGPDQGYLLQAYSQLGSGQAAPTSSFGSPTFYQPPQQQQPGTGLFGG